MNISICLATYRRPDRLRLLLDDLVQQRLVPHQVVVIDNDSGRSGSAPVELALAAGAPFHLLYAVEPRKNVAHARNLGIELATGDWLAFIDDDERAPVDWLERLSNAAVAYRADAVQGPVEPVLPDGVAGWLRRGRFYDWPRMASGTVVPRNRLRLGNLLLKRSSLDPGGHHFDPAYGQTGGEDGDWLSRLAQAGTRIVWCDEASVLEPVEPSRLSLRWLLMRSLRGGQDFARHALAGRYGPLNATSRILFFCRALLQCLVALALAVLSLPFGLHRSAHWLSKASANLGKLSAFAGLHYREYA
ncbi:glycosyltransferase family 2 protein [Pseudomarimonas salicorniae]|uniref:Glycosyltransferase n=1 Tax=Pseudomarimonas salicorniae TaxID=2933270 RepID=A0ABT0GG99_9GAMM|nr:glycosyltransferase [Lysobacter sp. CAU 1642]MCK7593082.1 glycosyltransferase [Lysobacter sp. CAU 1642]